VPGTVLGSSPRRPATTPALRRCTPLPPMTYRLGGQAHLRVRILLLRRRARPAERHPCDPTARAEPPRQFCQGNEPFALFSSHGPASDCVQACFFYE
jgi:hypothetical protein